MGIAEDESGLSHQTGFQCLHSPVGELPSSLLCCVGCWSLVCSDVVGPWFSAVPCDFTRYPGLACFVQDPDVLSFVERREILACMSVIVGLHRRLSAIQMLTLCNSDGRWRGAGRK